MKKHHGFTLLEITVLLAALAILAALLFPVLVRARATQNEARAQCQSQLKQIALGFKQYIQDYDELYPRATNSNKGFHYGQSDSWITQLSPYLKSTRIFRCPSDPGAKDEGKSSYAYNARLDERNESSMNNSALIVLNFEVRANKANWTQVGAGPIKITAPRRHLGGSNFSFVDGHVKWYLPGKVGALPPSKGIPTFVPG